MSTTTNFKRIALAVVAALGLSLFSSAPSQAAIVGTPTVTATNGTATIQKSDSTTAATIAIRYYATLATDTATVIVTMGSKPSTAAVQSLSNRTDSILVTARDSATATGVTTSGTPAVGSTDSALAVIAAAPTTTTAVITPTANSFGAVTYAFHMDSSAVRVAGTYTFNYRVNFYTNLLGDDTTKTVAGTVSIVVTDADSAAAGTTTAAATSYGVLYGAPTYDVGNLVDSTNVTAVVTPTGNAVAVVRVIQKTAAGLPARESITVTSTVGNIGLTCATAGKSLTIQASASGLDTLSICADGTSGTSTITVKTTSVTFANKSITFYAATPTTITATALVTTIGGTATNAILAVPKDALGNTLRSANAVYAYSDAVAVINTGTAPAGSTCGSYNSDYEGYVCSLTGSNNGTANITIRNGANTTVSTVASTPVAIKVNTAPAASFTLAFNKATYAPGEKAYIIVKPLDAAKGVIGGTTMTNLFATGGISSTMAFGNGSETLTAVSFTTAGTTAAEGFASADAIKLYTVYMPVSGGSLTISATGGALLPASGQVKVSATATVTDSGAAALAAVNALATTVASLRTLITTLTNLVLKIQKKVKA